MDILASFKPKKRKGRFRHELKFEIPVEDAENLFADIEHFGSYDKHSSELGSYEIASTYYDTNDLRFYRDREESVGYRRKIRLRSYNHQGESQALFIEIKEKHKNLVHKKRINMRSRDILDCGLPHNQLPLTDVIAELEDTAEAREMAYLHDRLELYPVVIIRYKRKAFIPTYEDDMRITLDTNITAGGNSLPVFDPNIEKSIIRPQNGVFEVKSNRSIPLWLHSALRRYQISQIRYSKYCLGVDALCGRSHQRWVPTRDEVIAATAA